jgi:TorA maturation chaperone TorD
MSDRKCMPTPSSIAALSRAKLARLIAAGFAEPCRENTNRFCHQAVQEEICAAARNLSLATAGPIAFFECLKDKGAFEQDYGRLLGHTVRSECPPYELEYRGSEVFQQSQTLADIMGFYRAFGFDVTGLSMERGDHIATQWEFLAVLSMMECIADKPEEASRCVDAQREFLREHAASWMPAFFERIRRSSPESALAKLADLAHELLRHWCAGLKVQIGPGWLELREITDEDSTITCGAPGAVELGPHLAAAMSQRD